LIYLNDSCQLFLYSFLANYPGSELPYLQNTHAITWIEKETNKTNVFNVSGTPEDGFACATSQLWGRAPIIGANFGFPLRVSAPSKGWCQSYHIQCLWTPKKDFGYKLCRIPPNRFPSTSSHLLSCRQSTKMDLFTTDWNVAPWLQFPD
jgi:hypothetical protein